MSNTSQFSRRRDYGPNPEGGSRLRTLRVPGSKAYVGTYCRPSSGSQAIGVLRSSLNDRQRRRQHCRPQSHRTENDRRRLAVTIGTIFSIGTSFSAVENFPAAAIVHRLSL